MVGNAVVVDTLYIIQMFSDIFPLHIVGARTDKDDQRVFAKLLIAYPISTAHAF